MNRPVSRAASSGTEALKLDAIFGQSDFVLDGKSTHQEDTQKSYSHHQTPTRDNLRERGVIFFVVVVFVSVFVSVAVSVAVVDGGSGSGGRISTNCIAGCIASTSFTSRATKGISRAFHVCCVRASWVGGGSTAIHNYIYWAYSPVTVPEQV